MNIFEIEKYKWWDHMEHIMENVNLCKVQILQNNHIVFTLFNSYNQKFYKYLSCSQILKCCIENEAFEDEPFAYFILDIYKRKLNQEEIEASLKYYHYGYRVDLSKLSDVYLIIIIGTEIVFEIICTNVEVLTSLDKYEELLREVEWGTGLYTQGGMDERRKTEYPSLDKTHTIAYDIPIGKEYPPTQQQTNIKNQNNRRK